MLLFAVVLSGCGSSAEQTDVPASSGPEIVDTTALPEAALKPPPILLVSGTETQRAVQGSYCVDYVDKASGEGHGICSDSAQTYPQAVTSVARGDRVTFVLPDAVLRADSSVAIRPLGCADRVTAEITLEPGTGEHRWRVDLEHGAYQLDVFARFKAVDGRTGDTSGSLGLTVAGQKKWDALGVTGVKRSMQVCPFSS